MSQPSFGGRRRHGVLAAGAVGGLILLLVLVTPTLATGLGESEHDRRGPPRNVLLLHAYPRLSPAGRRRRRGVPGDSRGGVPFPVYFYTEYLDLSLFDGDAPQSELRALLRRKYESRNIDLIVAAGSRAHSGRRSTTARSSSRARPVVFLSVDRPSTADLRLGTDVTGTWLPQQLGSRRWTSRFRLQADVRKAIVVAGSGPNDLLWLAAARQQLAVHRPHRSRSATWRAARSSRSRSRSRRCRRTRSSWSAPFCVTRRDRASTPVTRSRGSPAPPACPSTCSRTTRWAAGAWAATW